MCGNRKEVVDSALVYELCGAFDEGWQAVTATRLANSIMSLSLGAIYGLASVLPLTACFISE